MVEARRRNEAVQNNKPNVEFVKMAFLLYSNRPCISLAAFLRLPYETGLINLNARSAHKNDEFLGEVSESR